RRLASRFSAELTAKPWYDDLRLIGTGDDGREIVRVNRSGAGGAIRAVSDAELQPMGDRDYFQKTITLTAGDVYISPIELRQNQGVVEVPHVPIMRVAAPVFAPDGRRLGIVVANLDLRPVFDRIRGAARQGSRIYVVNDSGDYLLHPDPDREFGFQLGSPARLQDEYPGLMVIRHLGSSMTAPASASAWRGKSCGCAAARGSRRSKCCPMPLSSPARRPFAIRARLLPSVRSSSH